MPKCDQALIKIKDARREEIVVSALKVFCEKGYNGATINDIVKKAKCSHGLFYHYFENKKAIFDAVIETRGKNMADYLDEIIANSDNYVEKLKKLTEYTFANMKKDEIFAYRYYFFLSNVFRKAESGELPPKNCKKVPPHVRMFSFFDEGVKAGDFKDDVDSSEYARLYNCIIQGATLNFILCPKEFKPSFQFPQIDTILNIFKKRSK
ncbi:MAG: TetR/AcrR family transcriptional regulator [Clostridia bacterium]|nr:TetR/AcrR family transcriptional regulator [Clostridia bacterium]